MLRRRLFDVAVFSVAAMLLVYFVWHGLHGPRSIENHARLERQVEEMDVRLEAVRARRIALEARVRLLRPESIDPDLVDELARRELSFAGPNDLAVAGAH